MVIIYQQITKNIVNDITSYQYDTEGRMSRATNSMGSMTFTYNDQGGPQLVTYPNGRSIYYGFNGDNQRSFTADSHGYNVTYQYNRKKQLTAVLYASTQQPVVQLEYNSRGLLSRKVLGNGAFTTFTYTDDATELSSITNYNTNGTQSSSYSYNYDVKGRIVQISTTEGNWTFDYDPAGQMIKWTIPDGDATTYSYDGRSNRVVMSVNGRQSGYETNNMNQYMSFNQSDRFSYDTNGNLIRKMSRGRNESFVFDSEGKLIQTEIPGKTYTINIILTPKLIDLHNACLFLLRYRLIHLLHYIICRCWYYYDALSHLYMKNCTDGSSYQYLVDPFGLFGADIIAEINQVH